jgi:hypothetical protein
MSGSAEQLHGTDSASIVTDREGNPEGRRYRGHKLLARQIRKVPMSRGFWGLRGPIGR